MVAIGQALYLRPIGNEARYNREIRTCTVSAVGRKYFQVQELPRIRFHIDGLRHDGGQYISNWQAYESMQEIDDEKECSALRDTVSDACGYTRISRLSLGQLRKIAEIVSVEGGV